jgi:hypothetical protein
MESIDIGGGGVYKRCVSVSIVPIPEYGTTNELSLTKGCSTIWG